jgi:hypothetical protein
MSALTIKTLEDMFVYMGCANIPTQEAMDGAIPLESVIQSGGSDGVAAELQMERLEYLGPAWEIKAVCFSPEDNLRLATIQNVHWSLVSQQLSLMRTWMKKSTAVRGGGITDKSDAFVRMFYSEIDRYGRFIKFPVKKKREGDIIVSRLFNPSWLLEFSRGMMVTMGSDSDGVFESRRLSFLAPFMCGLAQSLPHYWTVKTRFDSVCPSLTLLTDATGVKEFWKLRDVPHGSKRRSALLHWVNDHWRKTRNDPDVEAYVRKHLRGSEELTQGNLSAIITPSRTDKSIDAACRIARDDMRKKRQDRRKRLSRC